MAVFLSYFQLNEKIVVSVKIIFWQQRVFDATNLDIRR